MLQPIFLLVDAPIKWYKDASVFLRSHKSILEENEQLHKEILYLTAPLSKMRALETENLNLLHLLNSTKSKSYSHLVASVINVDPDPFSHQIMINKGKVDGVKVGHPIVDANGIIGTVVNVSKDNSRVMLLSDAAISIPVECVDSGVRAISQGIGSINQIEIKHLPNTLEVKEGDLFVTSGLGGGYPAGYPVGVVTKVIKDPGRPFALVYLKPVAKLKNSKHLLLVRAD